MKKNGKVSSMPAGIGTGVGTSMIWTILWVGIAGKLLDAELLKMERIGYASLLILFSSGWLGSKLALHRVRKQKIMVCAATAAGYYLVLLAVTAVFFGGLYQSMGVTAMVVCCGSVLALLGENRRKSREKGRTRRGIAA